MYSIVGSSNNDIDTHTNIIFLCISIDREMGIIQNVTFQHQINEIAWAN